MNVVWDVLKPVVGFYAVVLTSIAYVRISIALERRAEARAMRQLTHDMPEEGQQ